MTHTPGPWAAKPTVPSDGFDCWTIIDSSGQDLAWSKGYQNDAEMQGNARLIAAAPDLLAALGLVWDAHGMDSSVDSSIWQTVRAAIRKATTG